MECEYCEQENADININDHWYHKDCYIHLRSKEEKLTIQEKLTFNNCCSVIIIFIVLIWLIITLWPIIKTLS